MGRQGKIMLDVPSGTLAAMAVLGTRAPLVYLPPLLLCSLITGAVTATACILLVQRVPVPGPS